MQKSNYKSFVVLIVILLLKFNLFSGNETRNARLQGTAFNSSVPFVVKDDKMTSTTWYNGFVDRSNYIKIEFGLNEAKNKFYSSAFNLSVSFDYKLTDANNNVTTFTNQQLSISYNPVKNTYYTNKSQLTKHGFYKIEITNIHLTNASNISLYDIYLEAEVSSERYYNFNKATAQLLNTEIKNVYDAATNELKISWNYYKGAEQYELEWAYVENYDGNNVSGTLSYLADSDIYYDFVHNSTRIVTQNNFYEIPLNYEHGYIVIRVRPIGIDPVNLSRLEGQWNPIPEIDYVQTVKSLPNFGNILYAVNAFETENYHWSNVFTFAENGKMGSGLSFSDALGFTRQSLARLNTEGKTIVTSYAYDHFGRSSISILPAPVPGEVFNYRNSLNVYKHPISGILYNYDKNIFDICTSCTPAGALNINAPFSIDPEHSLGASNYYSSFNNNKSNQQAYLPDAKSFPFSQTEYMPDMTGRIKRITMPGVDMKLGSNKETKFFYASPSQVELDRLFGEEAGRAINFKKNYIVDPNGQVSVNYIDGNNRTVATALTGAGPANLDKLNSNVGAGQWINENLLAYNDVDPANLSWNISTPFVVLNPNEQQAFVYSTTFTDYVPSDCNNTLCLDCIYDLEISIVDECGLEYLDHDNNPATPPQSINKTIGGSAPYDGVCDINNTYSVAPDTLIIKFLNPGQYTFIKKLKVSNQPLQTYKDLYLQNDACHQSLTEIQNDYLSQIDFSGCFTNCTECETSVDAYVTQSQTPGSNLPPLSATQIADLKKECKLLCSETISTCTKLTHAYEDMFFPGSVYAQYSVSGTGNYTSTDPYSILNVSNSLGINYTNAGPYKNADGSSSFVVINGTNTLPQNLSLKDFVDNFQPSWAGNFIKYHPEYCKLEWNCKISDAYAYDDEMKKIETFDDACALGFFHPVSSITLLPCSTATHLDPTFVAPNSMLTNAQITTFINSLNPYDNVNYPGMDIFEVVDAILNIQQPHVFGSDICTRDVEWAKFRELYLNKKLHYMQQMEANFYQNYFSQPNHGACSTVPAGYTKIFPDPGVITFPDGSQVPSNSSQSTVINAGAASFLQNCNATCWADTVNFSLALSGCPDYMALPSAVKLQLKNDLVQVCIRGCDSQHPDGSSNYPASNPTQQPVPVGPLPYMVSYPSGNPGVAVYSFADVLVAYGLQNSLNCSSLMITDPKPYNQSGIGSSNPANILDKCGCDKILAVDYDFSHGNTPSNITTARDLFFYRYQINLPKYNLYNCACKGAISAAGQPDWTPGYTWPGNSINELTTAALPIAEEIGCEKCINCNNLKAMAGRLSVLLSLPANTDMVQYLIDNPIAVTNYYNSFYNLNFTSAQYISFFQDCKEFSSDGTITNNLSPQGQGLANFLAEQAQLHLLTTNHSMNMGNSGTFFNSALYSGNLLPLPTTYNYNVTFYGGTGVTSQIIINILNSAGGNSGCNITLSALPGQTIDFTNVTAITNFKADFGLSTNPNVNHFVATVTVAGVDYTIKGYSNCYVLANSDPGANEKPQPKMCEDDITPAVTGLNPCMQTAVNNALNNAQTAYETTLINNVNEMLDKYKKHCFDHLIENIERHYVNKEYHYTLYYYDQAGDLVRTVMPAGVKPLQINTALPLNSGVYPDHGINANHNKQYVTQTKYNTYGSIVQDANVDGGTSNFYYDRIGRIVASQNAKQLGNNAFSYSLFDEYSRIIEVGEVVFSNPSDALLTETITEDDNLFAAFLTNGAKTQVTRNYYDFSIDPNIDARFVNGQENLRNRISTIAYYDNYNPANLLSYDYASHFTYDQHGNVPRIVNENKQLANLQNQKFKTLDYEFELISGNVTKVTYQINQPDQYIHTYYYDADNRLHEVFTSRDDVNWHKDAKYFYYEHGPLARTELGEENVQGLDYAYTIHGWLKLVNSEQLLANSDVGKDASKINNYSDLYAGLNKQFAMDAYGYTLNYFTNPLAANYDYEPIGKLNFNATTNIQPNYNANALYNNPDFDLGVDAPQLYNGNISSMVTSFVDIDPTNLQQDGVANPQITAYRYDQLNRLTQQKAFNQYGGLAWDTPSAVNYNGAYFTTLSYDANGNIIDHKRNGPGSLIVPGSNLNMDDLHYQYINNPLVRTNKLSYVADDPAFSGNYLGSDIDNQVINNYSYDDIGNLIANKEDCIADIQWTVDRKIKSITRNISQLQAQSRNLPDLAFEYDALRRRAVKIVKPHHSTTYALLPQSSWIYTYYSYDATGNILATYNRDYTSLGHNDYSDELKLQEFNIYGASRLGTDHGKEQTMAKSTFNAGIDNTSGLFNNLTNLTKLPVNSLLPINITENVLGKKQYELSNHLGNVIATVSDRKLQTQGTTVGFFNDYEQQFNNQSNTYAFAGSYSCKLVNAFSPNFYTQVYPGDALTANAKTYYTTVLPVGINSAGLLIISFVDANGNFLYDNTGTTQWYKADAPVGPNTWQTTNLNVTVPAVLYTDASHSTIYTGAIYTNSHAWNPNNLDFWVDNHSLQVNPINPIVDYYKPDILSTADYYAFGQTMSGRTYSSNDYRYGMNGKEKDDEISGSGNNYDFGDRIYEARLGRLLSVDPFSHKAPFASPYSFADNNPIWKMDNNGDSTVYYTESGQFLFLSNDGLSNSVVIVKKADQIKWDIWKKQGDKSGLSHRDSWNQELRKFGLTYNTGSIKKFYNQFKNTRFVNPAGEKTKWTAEHGAHLFNKGGQMNIGDEVIAGDPENTPWRQMKGDLNDADGAIHTHPGEGGQSYYYPNGGTVDVGPSPEDRTFQQQKDPTNIHIVVSKSAIFFYGGNLKKDIVIPFNTINPAGKGGSEAPAGGGTGGSNGNGSGGSSSGKSKPMF